MNADIERNLMNKSVMKEWMIFSSPYSSAGLFY
jgi:hypothetical protein